MVISSQYSAIRGTHFLLVHLASERIVKIDLDFPETPSTALFVRYIEIMAQKFINLSSLKIGIQRLFWERQRTTNPGVFAHPLPESIITNFGKMVSLKTLALSPTFVSINLLDTIGDLPDLRDLTIGNRFEYVPSSPNLIDHAGRKGKFTSLERLEIRGTGDLLAAVFRAYLSHPLIFLSNLELRLDGPVADSNALAFLREVPQSVRYFELLIIPRHSPMPFQLLQPLAACDAKLTTLRVVHPFFLSFKDSDRMFLQHWQNVTDLLLWKSDEDEVLLPPSLMGFPEGVPYYSPSEGEADIYTLGLIAECLPNLVDLGISVLACVTRSIDSGEPIVTFRKLKKLYFGPISFMNWQLAGFDRTEAARYIVAMVPSGTEIDLSFAREYGVPDFDPNIFDDEAEMERSFEELHSDHHAFLDKFAECIDKQVSEQRTQSGGIEGDLLP
jgi:hypothetical protein